MTLDLLVELLMIALLGATCIYCATLGRRLAALKAGQSDLQTAIADFDAATRRAETTLTRIERAGLDNLRVFSRNAHKAEELATELSVMVAAGGRIADRLEAAIPTSRAISVEDVRS